MEAQQLREGGMALEDVRWLRAQWLLARVLCAALGQVGVKRGSQGLKHACTVRFVLLKQMQRSMHSFLFLYGIRLHCHLEANLSVWCGVVWYGVVWCFAPGALTSELVLWLQTNRRTSGLLSMVTSALVGLAPEDPMGGRFLVQRSLVGK